MELDPKYRAVCFDMDGTLLNTVVDYVKMANLIYDIFEEMGVPDTVINRAEGYKFNVDCGYDWLREQGREEEIYSINGRVADASKSVELEHIDQAKPFPGAIELLKNLRSKGIKTGVLTRGCREYAEIALKYCGVIDYLDGIIARDDYPEPEAKPSPIAMKHMADAIGVKPEEILFMGDHKFDYVCAKSSGAGFIGVTSGTYSIEDWRTLDKEMNVVDTVSALEVW